MDGVALKEEIQDGLLPATNTHFTKTNTVHKRNNKKMNNTPVCEKLVDDEKDDDDDMYLMVDEAEEKGQKFHFRS